MKNIYLLGACGSIGIQTLDVIRQNSDKYKVIGMSVGRDISLANKLINEFNPQIVCVREEKHSTLIENKNCKIVYGDDGLISIATYNQNDNAILVNALVGSVGLKPTVESIKIKRDVALANKETLVMAGDLINKLLEEYKVKLYPIDSEHSAIWQCLNGENVEDVKRIIITASGGSFRDKSLNDLKSVTLKDALKHPNWSMGKKITIDSATMMNKGFEVIEAHHLFKIPYEKIDTIMHKESIIHSLVEYNDLSVKAILGTPDMRIPIMYAISYPYHLKYDVPGLDLLKSNSLNFRELSHERFKCLAYAYEAGKKGGLYPVALNAANEAAVNLFLQEKISFLKIEEIIRAYLDKDYSNNNPTIEEIIQLDKNIQTEILNNYGGLR